MSSNIFDQVTILIPTHNRHKHLERILNYYKHLKIKIIIADSSDLPFLKQSDYCFQYLHRPFFNYFEKMSDAIAQVETPYVVFCADDDFVIINAIEKCLDFLNNNHDYVSCEGQIIAVDKMLRYYLRVVDSNSFLDTIENDPIERISKYIIDKRRTFYQTYRTDVAKYMLTTLKSSKLAIQNFTPYIALIENYCSVVPLLFGKHKVLKIIFNARELDLQCKKYSGILTFENLNETEKTLYLTLLSTAIHEICQYEKEKARLIAIDIFNMLVQNGVQNSSFLKSFIKSLKGKLYTNRYFHEFISYRANKINNKKYNFSKDEAEMVLKEIKEKVSL